MLQSEQNRIIPDILRDKTTSVMKSRGSSPYYGLTDREISMAVALKFVLANGEQKAIHYHDIVSPIEYDGNSRITLLTQRITVIIEGRYLDDLFDYIIQHRVKWVGEAQGSFPVIEEGKLEVREIRFEIE